MSATRRPRSARIRMVAMGAIAAMVAAVAAAQQPTFSAHREVVRVDVLVTDRNRPVRGLRAADFEVRDSGVRQVVDSVGFEELPLNVILALDTSVSMSGERLEHLRDAARAVLETMRPGDKAAVLTFDNAVTLLQPLTATVALARESVGRIGPNPRLSGGGTAMIDAIFAALTLTAAEPTRSLLLVFTDGIDTSSWLTAERLLAAARRSNAIVYAVSAAAL